MLFKILYPCSTISFKTEHIVELEVGLIKVLWHYKFMSVIPLVTNL